MAGKALNGLFQRIRALAAIHTGRECSDRELLERYGCLSGTNSSFCKKLEQRDRYREPRRRKKNY